MKIVISSVLLYFKKSQQHGFYHLISRIWYELALLHRSSFLIQVQTRFRNAISVNIDQLLNNFFRSWFQLPQKYPLK